MAGKRELHPLTPVMLGTMTLANQSDDKQTFAQLDEFVKLGGIWIDTAELYPVPPTLEKAGDTEILIGKWIAAHPQLRSKIAIATKVTGPQSAPISLRKREVALVGKLPDAEGLPMPDFTTAQIERALEASLKRLQTDYVDLYQLHWPSRPAALWGQECFTEQMATGHYDMRPKGSAPDKIGVPFDEIVKCMGELLKKGKILSWGLSNETPFGIVHFCESAKRQGVPLPITIQNDFCLLDRRFDGALAEAASFYGIKLLAYGPLAGGTLTGKYFASELSVPASRTTRPHWRHEEFPKFQARYHAERSMEAAKKYVEVAKKHKLTPVQLALGWAATRFYMGSVIIGGNSLDHIVENYQAVMDGKKNITVDVLRDVNAVHEQRPNPNVTYSETL